MQHCTVLKNLTIAVNQLVLKQREVASVSVGMILNVYFQSVPIGF